MALQPLHLPFFTKQVQIYVNDETNIEYTIFHTNSLHNLYVLSAWLTFKLHHSIAFKKAIKAEQITIGFIT